MKLVTFTTADVKGDRIGLLEGEEIVDLTTSAAMLSLPFPATMLELIAAGDGERQVAEVVDAAGDSVAWLALAEATLRPPIPRPGKIIGVGLNYVEHVDESSRTLDTAKELPERPVLFDKPATAVVATEGEILHDGRLTAQLDWEVELAVVIGRTARRVAAADALDHVFGYSIINDISARDQRRSGQWFFSKGQDTYAPFGPVLVTAAELGDPQDVNLRLRVNGQTKQDSNTRHMLFKVRQLIEDISSGVTLEPGDVIATGSPAGVGAGMVPQQFLQPGDTVEAEIDGIGVLRNFVVDATSEAAATASGAVAAS
ncbi:MAG: fumarylacetoacetate hydrolase family protein [Actinobacteria bacterium]|nr:fumarylacetoacetate hydrolase family protein [Actinomycetota bacterium]